jgi:hypothetical protein
VIFNFVLNQNVQTHSRQDQVQIQAHHQAQKSTQIPVTQLVQLVSVVREEIVDLLIVPLAQYRIQIEVVVAFQMYQGLLQHQDLHPT